MSSRQVEFLVKLRDASQMIVEAANEFLKSMEPPELGLENEPAAVQELTFTTLKFETQKGSKLGDYEVAYKANNIQDKWSHAFNVLKNSNATIKDRYHGTGYAYSYWLYGEDKIYRQKLKPKPQT
jgi:hypothetical protein